MSNNVISHIGVVDSIAEGMVCVRIVQSSACSACKVASYCNSAESKEKIIEVRCSDADSYAVGQKVTVMADYCGSQSRCHSFRDSYNGNLRHDSVITNGWHD
jgi:hypothetical protein